MSVANTAIPLLINDPWYSFFPNAATRDPKVRFNLHRAFYSFPYFVTYYIKLILADFHEEICAIITNPETKNFLVEMPREHGKSTLICEAYVAWILWREPGCYVLIFSNTEAQAKMRVKSIKRFYEKVFPFTELKQPSRISWGNEAFELVNGSRCECYGAGSQVAGGKNVARRPKLILCDDIVSTGQRQQISDASIEEWFKETVTNLGEENCQIGVVGTPYRHTDIIAYLKKNPAYIKLHFEALLGKDLPALFEEGTQTLWPAHWPLQRLRAHFDK
ncbi:MAG: terminase family protein, partial [Patescibacteria group bacterium]